MFGQAHRLLVRETPLTLIFLMKLTAASTDGREDATSLTGCPNRMAAMQAPPAHNDDAQMSILRAAAKLLPPPMGSLSNGREVHRIGGISAAVITTLQ
mmetsp:Transcript_11896/g.35606  ORF Transcript_11896/g.35606 Transcript_11896/m.35606 type:complete len:98 (-) Transcript_11896:266-559(-)